MEKEKCIRHLLQGPERPREQTEEVKVVAVVKKESK